MGEYVSRQVAVVRERIAARLTDIPSFLPRMRPHVLIYLRGPQEGKAIYVTIEASRSTNSTAVGCCII
jgi:hypothetical protein